METTRKLYSVTKPDDGEDSFKVAMAGVTDSSKAIA